MSLPLAPPVPPGEGRWRYRRSLASRVILLTTVAVGLAVAFVAAGAYVTVRMQLQTTLDDSLRDRGEAVTLTFWPSEFSQLRGEFRRRRYAGGITANEGFLQLQFSIGAHGAHSF